MQAVRVDPAGLAAMAGRWATAAGELHVPPTAWGLPSQASVAAVNVAHADVTAFTAGLADRVQAHVIGEAARLTRCTLRRTTTWGRPAGSPTNCAQRPESPETAPPSWSRPARESATPSRTPCGRASMCTKTCRSQIVRRVVRLRSELPGRLRRKPSPVTYAGAPLNWSPWTSRSPAESPRPRPESATRFRKPRIPMRLSANRNSKRSTTTPSKKIHRPTDPIQSTRWWPRQPISTATMSCCGGATTTLRRTGGSGGTRRTGSTE